MVAAAQFSTEQAQVLQALLAALDDLVRQMGRRP
jgi:hypothetical protein